MIKRIRFKSEFYKNLITLMSGSVLAQAIPILISPFITRLYTPEEYGLFGLYISVSSVISSSVTGKYDMAVMLPRSKYSSLNLMYLSVGLSLFVSLLLLLVLLSMKLSGIESLFKVPMNLMLLLPLSVFIAGSHDSLRAFFNKQKYYKNLAQNRVEQSLTGGSVQLGLGIASLQSLGLIIGQLLGQSVAVFRFLFNLKNKLIEGWSISISRIRILAIRYKSFPKLAVPATLTSRAAQESLVILIGQLMVGDILGYVLLITRLVAIPSSILGTNLGEVFYQNISDTSLSNSYNEINKFLKRVLIISIPLYIIIYFGISFLFIPVFGEDWAGALVYLPYLVIVSFFGFIFSPLSMLFHYYNLQKWNLSWQATWLASNALLFYLYNVYDFSVIFLFQVYTFKQSILYLIGILGFMYYSKNHV